MMNQANEMRQLPPLGDISVRALTKLLADVWSGNALSSDLARRHARVDDIRSEIRRQERLGVGLRP
jgi:hypothetical protein